MAQHVMAVDAIDESEAAEPVRFGLDGVSYSVDLPALEAQALREALAPYVRAGRRIAGRKRVRKARARSLAS